MYRGSVYVGRGKAPRTIVNAVDRNICNVIVRRKVRGGVTSHALTLGLILGEVHGRRGREGVGSGHLVRGI
mgnify:CR=1 FL=1